MRKFLLVMAPIVSFTLTARADYFTVSEEKVKHSSESFVSPQDLLESGMEDLEEGVDTLKSAVFSLLKFTQHSGNYGDTSEHYNRTKHFGGWIRGHNGRCLNTRGLVLERDSERDVTYTSNGCTVATGHWQDPYGGRSYTRASDLQIDHFVPLKNAYISGASTWNFNKRCLYANFLGNNFHLLAVYGPENQEKSDMSPEGYMPNNPQYRCQYLAQWLKVKMIWRLNLSTSEKARIVELVSQNRCDLKQFTYPTAELEHQRQFIADNQNLCQ